MDGGGGTITNVDDVTDTSGISLVIPVGGIIQWGTSNAPSGWLICNGASVATNDYSALHTVIGYQYGGSAANFNIPDLRNRVPVGLGAGSFASLSSTGGVETVTLSSNQIPSHLHNVNPPLTASGEPSRSHTHSGTTGSQKTSHTHTGNTEFYRFTSSDGTHARPAAGTLAKQDFPAIGNQSASHQHDITTGNESQSHTHSIDIGAFNSVVAGGGQSHANMSPYIVVNYIIYAGK